MPTQNYFVTPKVVVDILLMHLRSMTAVCKNMSTDVTKQFSKPAYQVGDTVMVDRPYRFQVTEGALYQPQPLKDEVIPVKVDKLLGIHLNWDPVEKTLHIRKANQIARAAAIALSADINRRAAEFVAKNTPNYVGVPGTTPSDILTYLSAGTKVIEAGLPPNERLSLIVNRKFSDAYVSARAAYFNPQTEQEQAIKQGHIVDKTLGYDIFQDQGIYAHTWGTYTAGSVPILSAAAQADGGDNATMQISVSGLAGTGESTINEGDKFTIDGVYAIHPQTRRSTGSLKQFVVLQTVTSVGGAAALTIYPAITPAVSDPAANGFSQYANVNAGGLVNAALYFGAGALNTATASSGKVGNMALVMHRDAYAFVSVPLAMPDKKGVEIAEQNSDPETGLNVSLVRQYVASEFRWVTRFDCLVGFSKLYAAEMSCVINGGQ